MKLVIFIGEALKEKSSGSKAVDFWRLEFYAFVVGLAHYDGVKINIHQRCSQHNYKMEAHALNIC